MARGLLLTFLLTVSLRGGILTDVKMAVAQQNFAGAEAELKTQSFKGPEWIEAYSWMARGYMAAGKFPQAEKYAASTVTYVQAELKKRALDAEPHLPLALGAAIEVQSQVMAARGERDQAVLYLRQQ